MTGRIPDFFIAGAPKCGTTALYNYLRAHPSIFMPDRKEPGYFCTDIAGRNAIRDLNEYLALFARAPDGSIAGEASPMYLFSKVAIPKIMEMNPRAKIIAIMRNPIDALQSWHAWGLQNTSHDIKDFESAWRMQRAKMKSGRQPGGLYRYGEQLDRLLAHVPRTQFHGIIFEEFFADPVRYYRNLLDFLGVASDGRKDFPRINEGGIPRSRSVARLFWHLGSPKLAELRRSLRTITRAVNFHPVRIIRKLNRAKLEKMPLSPAFRAELNSIFADDIALLESLLGRRIDAWRERA